VSVKNNLTSGVHYLNQKADVTFDRFESGDSQSFSIPAATVTIGGSGNSTSDSGTLPETGPLTFALTGVLALGATILTRKYLVYLEQGRKANCSTVRVETPWL